MHELIVPRVRLLRKANVCVWRLAACPCGRASPPLGLHLTVCWLYQLIQLHILKVANSVNGLDSSKHVLLTTDSLIIIMENSIGKSGWLLLIAG